MLVIGDRGEFTIWVDDIKVAEKQGGSFPEPKAIIAAVRNRST